MSSRCRHCQTIRTKEFCDGCYTKYHLLSAYRCITSLSLELNTYSWDGLDSILQQIINTKIGRYDHHQYLINGYIKKHIIDTIVFPLDIIDIITKFFLWIDYFSVFPSNSVELSSNKRTITKVSTCDTDIYSNIYGQSWIGNGDNVVWEIKIDYLPGDASISVGICSDDTILNAKFHTRCNGNKGNWRMYENTGSRWQPGQGGGGGINTKYKTGDIITIQLNFNANNCGADNAIVTFRKNGKFVHFVYAYCFAPVSKSNKYKLAVSLSGHGTSVSLINFYQSKQSNERQFY